MILIFGGVYQGKLDFAIKKFNIHKDDICFCNEEKAEIDKSKKLIYNMEKYILACIREGKNEEYIKSQLGDKSLKDKVVICTDISQGVVPIEKEQRLLRDMTGRITTMLSENAEEVYRIFCGLSQKLK